MPTDIHGLFALLESERVRYVLVGGLALVLHGVDRLTADVDLAVDLAPEEALRLIGTLDRSGYRPAVPVDPRQLADPAIRETSRIPFDELWQDANRIDIGRDLRIPVASGAHLIRLKELAGRPQDLADIDRLRAILEAQEP